MQQGRDYNRWRRVDWLRNLRSGYDLRRVAIAHIENSEPALYAILEILGSRKVKATIEGRIADIRDRDRIHRLMSDFKPDIVFHAAALKHVSILERDWSEGVKTNVFGSIIAADAAVAAGAQAMVTISTDKAVEPVSMLGLNQTLCGNLLSGTRS